MDIAIIGTGISGLGAAYLLAPHHAITVFEKNPRIGGHSRTIDIPIGGDQTLPVDTGFIVFNNWNYPHLMGLFRHLSIPFEKSNMSFGVSIANGWLEYGSSSMFAQRLNLLRPQFWGMLADILRFNKHAPAFIEQDPLITLGECLDRLKMGTWFRRYYLLAMGAAIWSCPVDTILKFPAATFLRFFKNHGLLNILNRPQWYTVTGGSREYIKRLTHGFTDRIKTGCGAQSVRRTGSKVEVMDQTGRSMLFDHIIFACHADEALAMLKNPAPQEAEILSKFTYQANQIIVHKDASFMPRRKACWASWVYLSDGRSDQNPAVSLTYWMNNLQNLNPAHPVFITLNPGRRPLEELIYDEYTFTHPVFDGPAIAAQNLIDSIQGQDRLWFAGAYQRYGFHEDGLLSAVNIAQKIGVPIPWI